MNFERRESLNAQLSEPFAQINNDYLVGFRLSEVLRFRAEITWLPAAGTRRGTSPFGLGCFARKTAAGEVGRPTR